MPNKNGLHADFMRWYQTVSFEANSELAEQRYAAAQSLLTAVSNQKIEALIRIAFKARLIPTDQVSAEIKAAFGDEIDGRKNDRELEVLCGATLAMLIAGEHDHSTAAALSVLTTDFAGGRTNRLPMDLVGLAGTCLRREAEMIRTRPSLKTKISISKLDFDEAKAKIQQIDLANLGNSLDSAAARVQRGFEELMQAYSGALDSLEQRLRVQDEELQILWWLFGERSFEVEKPFSEIEPEWRPLVVARELADATEVLPGPSSSSVMLERAGLKRKGKKIAVAQAVNACDLSWMQSLSIGPEISPISSPLHFAIYRRLEAGNDTAWIEGWEAASQTSASHAVTPLVLGELFYRERLLALF